MTDPWCTIASLPPFFFYSHGSKLAPSLLACECELNVNCVRILCKIRTKFTLSSLNFYMTRHKTTWYAKQEIPFLDTVSYANAASCGPGIAAAKS